MKSALVGAWRRYRGLPVWAQVTMAVLGVALIAAAGDGNSGSQRVTAGTTVQSDEQLPRASTTSIEPEVSSTSTTVELTTTTTSFVPETTTAPSTAPPESTLPPTTAEPETAAAPPVRCHPSYVGVCLPPDASDVDCAGGSGNGPVYVSEQNFGVVGPDVYDLDRNGNGVACES